MINENRKLWKYIVFTILTLGIYGYYFIYKMAEDVNTMCKEDGESTSGLLVFVLLSFITCGFYAIYWYYKLANRLQANAPKYGLYFQENGTTVLMWDLFGLLICGIGPFIAMHILIKNMNAMARAYNTKIGRNPENYVNVNNMSAPVQDGPVAQNALTGAAISSAPQASAQPQQAPVQPQQMTSASGTSCNNGWKQQTLSASQVCPVCGGTLKAEANFCVYCGARIERMAAAPRVPDEMELSQETDPKIPKQTSPAVQPNQMGFTEKPGTTVLSNDTYGNGETTILKQEKPQPIAILTSLSTNQAIQIAKDAFRIGKNKAMVDYQILNNTTVSRIHAVIYRREGAFFIADQKSTNGTFVNGLRVTGEAEIHNGDRICMSNEEFIFQILG
ncbi:DUF4234 domain-containing protein [Butyricicoccus sp.]|uniref:DUF4234 domain-containing protein n=1 Tax=Butyricicoccus sp. TaxID=2049021 RepID=UPI003F149C62